MVLISVPWFLNNFLTQQCKAFSLECSGMWWHRHFHWPACSPQFLHLWEDSTLGCCRGRGSHRWCGRDAVLISLLGLDIHRVTNFSWLWMMLYLTLFLGTASQEVEWLVKGMGERLLDCFPKRTATGVCLAHVGHQEGREELEQQYTRWPCDMGEERSCLTSVPTWRLDRPCGVNLHALSRSGHPIIPYSFLPTAWSARCGPSAPPLQPLLCSALQGPSSPQALSIHTAIPNKLGICQQCPHERVTATQRAWGNLHWLFLDPGEKGWA